MSAHRPDDRVGRWPAAGGSGPLTGIRVVEIASEHAAFAGKLLGEMGADVVVIEPPGGHATRLYAPFVSDEPDSERSLWWWHYNTSKRGVTLDLESTDGAETFRDLVADADVVLEAEVPGRLGRLHLAYDDLQPDHPSVVWVSMTPWGANSGHDLDPVTDLTLLAAGGAVWACGYDDHSLPPVRGGGNQAFHTASIFAVLSALTALVHREATGTGQFIDVNMYAAVNITTESSTYQWLVAGQTVQRQTGRAASVTPTTATQVMGSDGKIVQMGAPPPRAEVFTNLLEWLDELGLKEEFPDSAILQLGAERDKIHSSEIGEDPLATEIFRAERDVLHFLGSRMSAYDFFTGAQHRGLACGIIYAPEETLSDPHFLTRGFPISLYHEDLGRDVVYPGVALDFARSPATISRRAPKLGEHNDDILGRRRE